MKAFPTLGGTTRISDSVRSNGTLDVGTPVALFTMRPGAAVVASPDGQRFLLNTPLEDAVTTPLTVVLNWKPKRR